MFLRLQTRETEIFFIDCNSKTQLVYPILPKKIVLPSIHHLPGDLGCAKSGPETVTKRGFPVQNDGRPTLCGGTEGKEAGIPATT
jgi:hypothetical protein